MVANFANFYPWHCLSSKGCLQRGREAGTPGGVGEIGAASPRFCGAVDALCRGLLHRVGHGHDEAGQLAAGPPGTGTQTAEVCARRRRGDLDAWGTVAPLTYWISIGKSWCCFAKFVAQSFTRVYGTGIHDGFFKLDNSPDLKFLLGTKRKETVAWQF